MLRPITLLIVVFMLAGCGGTTTLAVSKPVTEERLKEHFNAWGPEVIKAVDRKMDGRLDALKNEINGHVTADGGLTRTDMANYNAGLVKSQNAMAEEMGKQSEELRKIQRDFAERYEALVGTGSAGSGSASSALAEVEIETTVNGVTIKAKGPAGSHTEVERLIREQQDRRDKDRQDLFLRNMAYRNSRVDAVESRVTILESSLAIEVARINRDLLAADIRVTNKEAELRRLLQELAARCSATVLYCAPPVAVPSYPCYTYRVGFYRQCLHVW